MRALLRRIVHVEDREVPAMLWAFAQFFLLIAGNYLMRPVRESLGSTRGSIDLNWLYSGTFIVSLVATAAWAAIVARVPVERFLTLGYQFFAASFLALWALLRWAPDPGVELAVGYAFFVWYSGYVVFVVSMFWSRAADLFSHAQGQRLFPFVAAGGSLGAIAGSSLAASLGSEIGTVNLLLVPVFTLQAVCFCSRRLGAAAGGRHEALGAPAQDERIEAPPSVLQSFARALRSRLLVLIAVYMLIATFCGTFVYTMQSDVARAAFPDRDARTEYFGTLDFAVNVLAFGSAIFLTPRIIRWIGVATALVVLPSVYVLGFSVVSLAPQLWAVAALQVAYRAAAYGVTTPAREVLFTLVSRENKYRAKNAIDTFVWRGGDVAAIWLLELLLWAGPGEEAATGTKVSLIAAFGIPVALLWLVAAGALRRQHGRAVTAAT